MSSDVDAAVIRAAQAGDERARELVAAESLPLVYNIVGRGLRGHVDVDDVTQETMLRALDKLNGLRDPGRFRSWLVAIAVNQIRGHWRQAAAPVSRLDEVREVPDPQADFVDLTIARLGLSGQRREVAEATRWLDPDDRSLLSLWWLESTGELTRADLAAALEITPQHTAVRVQRMKAQLDAGRIVVRALAAEPPCVLLQSLLAGWDGEPSGLWRKRIARHANECTVCSGHSSGLLPAERLLVGLALVPLPAALGARWGIGPTEAAGGQTAASDTLGHTNGRAASRLERRRSRRRAAAATAAALVTAGGAGAFLLVPGLFPDEPEKRSAAAQGIAFDETRASSPSASASSATPSPTSSTTSSPSPSVSPSSSPSPSPSSRSTTAGPSPSKSSAAPKRTTQRSSRPSPSPTVRRTTSTPAPPPPDNGDDGFAQEVTRLVNAERLKQGCGSVSRNALLDKAALGHSQDMAARDYFSHSTPEGTGPGERITAAGYRWSTYGENIARGQQTPAQVMDSWMNSSGHRANILNCNFKEIGVGVHDAQGGPWWTQVFASSR
ncbi:sigma-70 family RNA polymerase sigma factor [Streptomyces sp. MUM 203J]|uniref:sigma-70 family RNA polymerase sigma factor n=1 Tax=Streptomyces sp. MUM 203J TaxID=2791990 RepID=UPI001F048CD8|nr:sigma-70 family RNA polymerase sigma factor [Streptomyces sp. MUM 203J]MCH0539712.1 sigma-70 family RNA polymerase sigma factor [Streptomyces sp. MUM 203J]